MALLTLIFERLRIPLAQHKCLGPLSAWSILELFWIVAKWKPDYLWIRFRESYISLVSLLSKICCTKLELLQLSGRFNFASRVILPGRSFVSYLIHLSTTMRTSSICSTGQSLSRRFTNVVQISSALEWSGSVLLSGLHYFVQYGVVYGRIFDWFRRNL